MLSEKPWRLDAVLVLLSGLLLSLCVGGLAMMLLERLLPAHAIGNQKFFNFVVSTLSFHGVGLILVHYFLRQHSVSWKDFLGATAPRRLRALIAAGMVAVLAVPLAWGLMTLLTWIVALFNQQPAEQAVILVMKQSPGMGQRVFMGLSAIVIAPMIEETLYRGILYPVIKQQGYPKLALFVSALLFGASHLDLLRLLPLTLLGIALALLYEKTDMLLACIVAHSLFNAANFVNFIISPN